MRGSSKKCNLSLRWAHLPDIKSHFVLHVMAVSDTWVLSTCSKAATSDFYFGPVWILFQSHPYRKRCIRAHHAYAQVGSKSNITKCHFLWMTSTLMCWNYTAIYFFSSHNGKLSELVRCWILTRVRTWNLYILSKGPLWERLMNTDGTDSLAYIAILSTTQLDYKVLMTIPMTK